MHSLVDLNIALIGINDSNEDFYPAFFGETQKSV